MTSNLSKENAKLLNENGSIILILNTSECIEIGIDYYSWVIKSSFIGFKMIPPGPHIIYSKQSSNGIYTFFYLYTELKQVYLYEWDKSIEMIIPCKLNEIDKENYIKACKKYEFDNQLGPYPYKFYDKWCNMSNYINSYIINKLMIDNNIFFSVLPDYKPPSTIKPSDIINYMMDTSKTLINTIENNYNNDYNNFLGEYQISFISFIIGEYYDVFNYYLYRGLNNGKKCVI